MNHEIKVFIFGKDGNQYHGASTNVFDTIIDLKKERDFELAEEDLIKELEWDELFPIALGQRENTIKYLVDKSPEGQEKMLNAAYELYLMNKGRCNGSDLIPLFSTFAAVACTHHFADMRESDGQTSYVFKEEDIIKYMMD